MAKRNEEAPREKAWMEDFREDDPFVQQILETVPPQAAELIRQSRAEMKAQVDAKEAQERRDCPDCRGPEAEVASLRRRLNRIAGQVRGIQGMVEKDAYCTDILTQISAVQSALSAVSRELLASHIRTCVVEDIRKGDTEVVDDLVATIQKMMK